MNSRSSYTYSLPTEAEWEFAARGGNLGKNMNFIYSGSNDLDTVAWRQSREGGVNPVGQKKPNLLGLYDMTGNASEWCSDQYQAYPGCTVKYACADCRVVRGGSCFFPPYCRNTSRGSNYLYERNNDTGFRLVRR